MYIEGVAIRNPILYGRVTTDDSNQGKGLYAPSKQATADYYYTLLMTHRPCARQGRKTGQTEGRKRLAGKKRRGKKQNPLCCTCYCCLRGSVVETKKRFQAGMGGFLRHIALPRLGFADLDAFFSWPLSHTLARWYGTQEHLRFVTKCKYPAYIAPRDRDGGYRELYSR